MLFTRIDCQGPFFFFYSFCYCFCPFYFLSVLFVVSDSEEANLSIGHGHISNTNPAECAGPRVFARTFELRKQKRHLSLTSPPPYVGFSPAGCKNAVEFVTYDYFGCADMKKKKKNK